MILPIFVVGLLGFRLLQLCLFFGFVLMGVVKSLFFNRLSSNRPDKDGYICIIAHIFIPDESCPPVSSQTRTTMEKNVTKNLIIGFGKAGKTLAADLAKHGQEVIIVEKSDAMYGGTCINIGCIPSKKLIVEGQYGARTADKQAVFNQAVAAKETLVDKLRQANFNKLNELDKVRVIHATATFVDSHTVQFSAGDVDAEVTAERIFINTGSVPAKLPVEGADGKRIFDSTAMLSPDFRPERLVIVGGGYISLEFACMYRAFGSKVTILEAGDTFLPREDADVAEEVRKVLTEKGIDIHTGVTVTRFTEHVDETLVETLQGTFPADAVLVAIGRRPATAGLALDKAGVETDERGYIKTDEHLHALPHIWAMGDVAGSPQFTYVSLDDYRIVRDELLGTGSRTTRNRGVLPTAVFTEPQLSHVGLNEKTAKAQGRNVVVKTLRTEAIPKAKVLGKPQGMLKAVIDIETDEILGVTLFCEESHEIINLFKMAIDNGVKASYVRNMIFTHPTMAEGLNDLFA